MSFFKETTLAISNDMRKIKYLQNFWFLKDSKTLKITEVKGLTMLHRLNVLNFGVCPTIN